MSSCELHRYHAPRSLGLVVHHVQPLGMAGPDTSANKVVICPTGHLNTHRALDDLLAGRKPRGSRTERALAQRGYDAWVAAGKPGHAVYEARPVTLGQLPAPSGRKLGRKPLTPDSRDLKLARYLTPALPPAPKTVKWQTAVPSFPMLLNDRIGDCVIAGMLHQQQVWAAVAGNPTFAPTDAQALALYRKITGYDPANPSSDQGTDPREALRYWKATGAAGHKILAYAAVDPKDHATVKQAISLFGGLGVCLALPKYAETEHGKWLLERGANSAPGSWGGHWVCATGYDHTGIQLVTWGQVWTMTWGFLDRYCDGLYAAISPDWMNAAGKSPAGLDLTALTADLAAI